MMNTASFNPAKPSFSLLGAYDRALALADRIPLSIVQLAARLAVAHVFWSSAQAIQLFAMEYRVPLLPPEVAALLGTATELGGALLILVGLFTRLSAVALLGLVTVIQVFVYPGHWAEHLLWASLLLLLLARGPGKISLDYLAKRLFARNM